MLYILTDNELNISVESLIILIMGPKLYIFHSIGEGTLFDSYWQMFLIFSTNADSSEPTHFGHLHITTTQSALLEAGTVWVFVITTQSVLGSRNPLWVVLRSAQSVVR